MTIDYYNKNASRYITETFNLSMEALMNEFTKYLSDGAKILDLGCGSGRDSLAFKNLGYDVHAIDGSKEMVDHARKYLGNRVHHTTFEDYNPVVYFDGIWALATLLHVPRKDISRIIGKYIKMLNPDGIFFMSFKERIEDYTKDGRNFTCFTEDGLLDVLNSYKGIEIVKVIHTTDIREGRDDEKWLSIIIKKVK